MSTLFKTFAAAVVAVATPVAALADTTDTTAAPTVSSQGVTTNAFPAIFGAASAVAAPSGTLSFGVTLANPRQGIKGNGSDGEMSIGLTVGNPIDAISLTFGLNISSLKGFADDGSLSLSASRVVAQGSRSLTFLGATAANLAPWGADAALPEKYSVYMSHVTSSVSGGTEYPIQFTLGYGNDLVYSSAGNGALSDGIFYGVGVGVAESLSVSLSGTETQLNAGVGTALPFGNGLGVSAGVYDITDNVNRRQFAITFGYGLTNIFGN